MKKSSTVLRIGARNSKLSLVQAEKGLARLADALSQEGKRPVSFELEPFSSPGDRDKKMDLQISPGDFFTRDLDDAVLAGTLDAAIHSAKDLPEICPEGIDWFWLPWREDPRDVLVAPRGKGVPESGTVGVSSGRREAYCRTFNPGLEQKLLRGTIDERMEQLDRGEFDLIVTAAAAMKRLGLEDRITSFISEEELEVPEGQGYLALTYRKGDRGFNSIRSLFVKSVRFVGAGPGRAGLCSSEGVEEIRKCDVCFHDALMDQSLAILAGNKAVYTGKRSGHHSLKQEQISQLILDAVRQCKRVVRLKGGDPGIFGRLKEETDLLDIHSLAYRVIPGISSMIAATTGTGMLLTKRGSHRGFTALTPRLAGGGKGSAGKEMRVALPLVLFMSIKSAGPVLRELLDEGRSGDEPAAAVFNAGSESPLIIRSTLSSLAGELENLDCSSPGLLLVGEAAADQYGQWGALGGDRVMLTSSETLMPVGRDSVIDFGGLPVEHSLVSLEPVAISLADMESFDWICLTSPSSVRFFLSALKDQRIDMRSIPSLMVCGRKTAAPLEEAGLFPEICPDDGFSARGLLEELAKRDLLESRVLKLSSDRAGKRLAEDMRNLGMKVTDRVLYTNTPCLKEDLPSFDSIVFTSTSGVESFLDQYGASPLEDCRIAAIGIPTAEALKRNGIGNYIIGREATLQSAVESLALDRILRTMEQYRI